MSGDIVFLYCIAVISFVFALFNCVLLVVKRNNTAKTVGTIISIKMPNPESCKFRNSKWAIVSYKVNGRTYQSQNRIQVPLEAQIGTTVTIRYDEREPGKLYSFSILRVVVSFVITAICILVVAFKLV